MDQEAVSLAPNLQGKKKKKKKAKKVSPNAFLEHDDNAPYDHRKTSLANAGASIGHMSSYQASNQGAAAHQPQEALPDLDLDLNNDGEVQIDANDDWDYKDFAGAKVDYSSNNGTAAGNARPKFDINNLGNNSFDADDDLL